MNQTDESRPQNEAPGETLFNRFRYHAPGEEIARRHEQVRETCLQAALRLESLTPRGREQSLAITKLEEAMMWANAAIARNQKT